jgi:hypothetical protein
MLNSVAVVSTDVSQEYSASIIGVTRLGEMGTMLGLSSNWRTMSHCVTFQKTAFFIIEFM